MVRFLLVDDSPTIRYQLTEMLMKQGVKAELIRSADDGVTALRAFNEFRPDVVFMDINMPNQDGVQTAIQLLRMQPSLKIVVVTGLSRDNPQSVKMISDGAYAFIQKPLEAEDIKRVMKKLEMGEGGAGRIMSS